MIHEETKGQSTIYTKILASKLHMYQKILRIMAINIRKKHQFSLETLYNNLDEALQDLDNAMQPQLLIGLRNGQDLDNVPVSLAQLVGTLHNLCRGWGSNPRHPSSPHLSSSH